MSHPPPPDEKGAVSAATPTTPKRESTTKHGQGTSGRRYDLKRTDVNASPVDADPRASADGATGELYATEAERFYLEICQERTGEKLSEEVQARRERDRAKLIEQSYRIGYALESEGIPAFGKSKLTLVGVLSGKTVELPDFRNIVFIPAVAQRKRHQMLKHLEYFIQEHPYARMWVLTSGPRTPLEGVRDRVGELHRRISKLNAQPFMKAAGAQIVFRSTELGEVERDELGRSTFHIHAHTITYLERRLSKEQFTHLIGSVRAWWVYHFDEARRIHKVRETCKYCVKPADLETLTAPELAELHRQLLKLHLVQPMGLLKEQLKMVKDLDRKLVRMKQGERSTWAIVPNWNQSRKGAGKEKGAAKVFATGPEDWVLTTLPPSHAISEKSEPLAVVLNHTGERLVENRRIRLLRQVLAEQFHHSGECPKE